MTTHAAAGASGQATAETIEGPEALKAYVDRRIQLFEHFKLRESEAVHHCHPNCSMHCTWALPVRPSACQLLQA